MNASSRVDQREVQWFIVCKHPDSTLASLADSGKERFKGLDIKLATAVRAIVEHNKAILNLKQISQRHTASAWAKNQSLLTGRQLVWLMLRYLRTNPSMQQVYTATDLDKVRWKSDNEAHTFLY